MPPPPNKPSKLHPRNRHQGRYDFKILLAACPELAPFVHLNKYDNESIDFFDPAAVKMLNKALLMHYYGLDYWDIPPHYLCPPIPGRADYIHHIADLLAESNGGKIPKGKSVQCLDIGVGANCIYPIIGHKEYGWSFRGSDIDAVAIEAAQKIITENPSLKGKIALKWQKNPKAILSGIFQKDEYFDLTLCNPPFHASAEEAQAVSRRKLHHLKAKKTKNPRLNFGGQNRELWTEGGEQKFVGDLIRESTAFSTSCFWFSTLISKEAHLKNIYRVLEKVKAQVIKTIPMGQGNKKSRIVAWTFLSPKQQKTWAAMRWK